jgi:hypothetical protein
MRESSATGAVRLDGDMGLDLGMGLGMGLAQLMEGDEVAYPLLDCGGVNFPLNQ